MSKVPTLSDILGLSYDLLPQESQLLLITSVLGTSPSWLAYSLLYNTLTSDSPVVFVSFSNDYTYFRDGAKRHGLDLASYLKKGNFVFVDGFSKLFLPTGAQSGPTWTPSIIPSPRGGIQPRGVPAPPRQQPLQAPSSSSSTDPIKYISFGPTPTIADSLKQLEAIKAAIKSLPVTPAKPRLILEGLEVLMSAGGVEVGSIEDLIYDLREITSTAAIIMPSDSALIQTSESSTILELSHANLVVSLGHVADAILSLRLLDTGVAKDISGVLKVTRGAGNLPRDSRTGVIEEKEMLYYEGDGGVKIFARGAGGH
ncbi:hypothetical protein H072_9609 [Dactylellina haptotyla CBS 200.50]|uniref:KaiC-like domain-containing protein n=1 Tax=Dactylellina haptotyla (strain CBS 200.50) TaxID=1284197 RepID=S8A228_DACHA|nr:hypothetical protein H072_9609 [Dactylellina haptotyla CBS 200.50]